MADLICRWRNAKPSNVVELVNSLPHRKMKNADFRKAMEQKWDGDFFRAPYQLACQLGLYYESDDGYYYPRFKRDINELEAKEYLLHWAPRYYVPNPYTGRDGFNNVECPTFMIASFYDYVKDNPGCQYADAYKAVFKEDNSNNNDIVRNVINSYSGVMSFAADGTMSIISEDLKRFSITVNRNDKQAFFNFFNMERKQSRMDKYAAATIKERQQMFYDYLKNIGKADSSARQYAFYGAVKDEVVEIVKKEASKDSLFEVVDILLVQKIFSLVNQLEVNKNQNNLLSASITNYKNFLDYLEGVDDEVVPEITEETPSVTGDFVVEEKALNTFAYKVFKFFSELDRLKAVKAVSSLSNPSNKDDGSKLVKASTADASLTGLFIQCSADVVKQRNVPDVRWDDRALDFDGADVYISTQWNSRGNYQLTFKDLQGVIKACYPSYEIGKNQQGKYVLIQGASTATAAPFSVKDIAVFIKETGLKYTDNMVARFALSLMTKRFVILSGLAGSGKTQLAIAFARAMSAIPERQMRVVSVGADWTNREPLLGYPNALAKGEYVLPDSKVLELIIDANANPSHPYFLILDEMNLSYVERYFADFLSTLESDEKIHLWNPKKDDANKSLKADGDIKIPDAVSLPKNLFIVGTINVDETTYMFSPKVLDRANVIEFKINSDEMKSFLSVKPHVNVKSINGKASQMSTDFVRIATSDVEINADSINEILLSFFDELKKVNAEFGYRSAIEIGRFIALAKKTGDLDEQEAIDAAIVQKLLPKLHGSRKKLVPVLKALWDQCLTGVELEDATVIPEETGYPLAADKILRMYHGAVDNGFTSFAEA